MVAKKKPACSYASVTRKHPKAQRPNVAVIGDLFVDVQSEVPRLPAWDSDVESRKIEILPGGSSCNTARQLAALIDLEVVFFSTVGKDTLGDAALGVLRSQGFGTDHIARLDLPSSACIVLSGMEDRAMVSCYSTVSELSLDHVDEQVLSSSKHLHIGGYYGGRKLQTPALPALLARLRARGVTVSLGVQADPEDKWTGIDNHFQTLLPHLDLLIGNESEQTHIARALGCSPSSFSSLLTIVTTRGAEGAAVEVLGQEKKLIRGLSVDKVIDATGGGDAFTAGFLAEWVSSHDAIKAAHWGNACAALAIQRAGACPQPLSLADVKHICCL